MVRSRRTDVEDAWRSAEARSDEELGVRMDWLLRLPPTELLDGPEVVVVVVLGRGILLLAVLGGLRAPALEAEDDRPPSPLPFEHEVAVVEADGTRDPVT